MPAQAHARTAAKRMQHPFVASVDWRAGGQVKSHGETKALQPQLWPCGLLH